MAIQIEPVTNRHGLREFIEFPFQLYRHNAAWVPPFTDERFDFFNPQKNPYFAHARAQLFLARRNGEIVGTIAGCVDEYHNQSHHELQCAFGFFETINDPEVASALLGAVEGWARSQHMAVLRGPLSFSINHEYGLLIENFDDPPMIMTTYNPPYYAPLLEANGYTEAIRLFAYIGELDQRWHDAPPKVFRAAEKAVRQTGVQVRNLNMRNFAADAQKVRQVYDQAWSQLWDFVPISPAEIDQLARQLRAIVDPDLVFLAETADGTPVGVSITLPDLNQALLRSGGGSMFPLGLARFLWHRREVNQARLWAMGVVEGYRNRGIDAVFYVETARAALAKGYQRLEGSLILENNTMMNRIIERLGGERYKTYCFYEKFLML